MPWGVVAAVGGALISSDASRHASNTQADTAKNAAQMDQSQYNQNRADLAPWRKFGSDSLNKLNALEANPSSVTSTPGYQFNFGQGMDAVNQSAAAHGGLDSGATLKGLMRFGEGYSGQAYQQQFNNLSSDARMGLTATDQTATLGANSAANQGNDLTQAGNAQAAGAVGQANAINGGMGMLAMMNSGGGVNTGSDMSYGNSNPENNLNNMNTSPTMSQGGYTYNLPTGQ